MIKAQLSCSISVYRSHYKLPLRNFGFVEVADSRGWKVKKPNVRGNDVVTVGLPIEVRTKMNWKENSGNCSNGAGGTLS